MHVCRISQKVVNGFQRNFLMLWPQQKLVNFLGTFQIAKLAVC